MEGTIIRRGIVRVGFKVHGVTKPSPLLQQTNLTLMKQKEVHLYWKAENQYTRTPIC